MKRRNGYSDFAIPLKLLRDRLRKAMRDNPRMNHEELVAHGVDKLMRDGKLFAQNEDEFLGYIVTNALNMAENDLRAAGVNPVSGTRGFDPDEPSTPRPQPKLLSLLSPEQIAAERAKAKAQANERLADLAPIMFMKLPTPFGKPLGELTGKEGRKLAGWMGAIFKGVPDNKRLIDVKGEAQLREIWAKRK
jgi:hypothetical protein